MMVSGTNKKNCDILKAAFEPYSKHGAWLWRNRKGCGAVIWARQSGGISNSRSAMNKKQIFDFHQMLILPIAWLVTFTGCSAIVSTAENHRVTRNLVKYIDEDHEKSKNPRVRPGQPYAGLPELY